MIELKTALWWRATLALGLGSMLVFINLYMAQPLLPQLASDLAVSPLSASWVLSIATLGLALGLLFWARVADQWGRRWVMLGCLLLASLISVLISHISDFSTLLIARAVQGFFLAGLPATAIAYMSEEFTAKALMTSIGIYIAANSLGGITGRVLGGVLAQWGGHWQSPFLLLGTASLIVWLGVVKWLPASQCFTAMEKGQGVAAFIHHLKNPRLWPIYLIGGLNFMVFLNQFTYVAFYLAAPPIQLASGALGLLFLTYLTGTLASSVSGWLIQRFGNAQTLLAAIVLFAIGNLGLLSHQLPVILLTLLIDSFAFFLAHACASSWIGRSVTEHRALASALYLVFYYMGASLGGVYLYPFWSWAGMPGVVLGSLVILMVTAGLTLRLKANQRGANAQKLSKG